MANKTLNDRVQDLAPELFTMVFEYVFTAAEGSRVKLAFASDGRTVKTDRIIGDSLPSPYRWSTKHPAAYDDSSDRYKKQYYGKTDFVFENGEVMAKWVRDLTPATRDMVRSVKLFSWRTQHDALLDVRAAMIFARGLLRRGTVDWTYTSLALSGFAVSFE